jgi:hypothetical protein
MRLATGLLIVLLIAACSHAPVQPETPAQEAAVQAVMPAGQRVTIDEISGPLPGRVELLRGQNLTVAAAMTVTLTSETLGFAATIPALEQETFTFTRIGTHTVTCQGCPDGRDTFTIELH